MFSIKITDSYFNKTETKYITSVARYSSREYSFFSPQSVRHTDIMDLQQPPSDNQCIRVGVIHGDNGFSL